MSEYGRSFAAPHLFRAANIRIKFCVSILERNHVSRGPLMNLAEFVDGHRDQHLAELYEFLRIPSVSAKSEHKPDIERGANWVAGNLRAAGFSKIEIVPTGLHPLVYAESLEAPGKPTILFYGHYDVQPPEPLSLWTSVQKNKEKLKADALVVSDTSMLGKGVPSITYGLRGLNYYQIELTGP